MDTAPGSSGRACSRPCCSCSAGWPRWSPRGPGSRARAAALVPGTVPVCRRGPAGTAGSTALTSASTGRPPPPTSLWLPAYCEYPSCTGTTICLSIVLSIYHIIYLSIYLSIYRSIDLSIVLFVCLYVLIGSVCYFTIQENISMHNLLVYVVPNVFIMVCVVLCVHGVCCVFMVCCVIMVCVVLCEHGVCCVFMVCCLIMVCVVLCDHVVVHVCCVCMVCVCVL